MKITKTAVVALGVAAVVLAAGAAVAFWPEKSRDVADRVAGRPAATPTPAPTPALDPMLIEAMRRRTYAASTLTPTKDLGDQGGYHEAVNSFVSDGLTEYALVSTPNGPKPAGGWPVVILAHGYINPATYQTDGPNYAVWISSLARAGFLVVKPDYRGHGQSQGQPAGGHYSPVYAYDLLNFIATLKQYPEVNPARIGLLGHSMGGHEALRAIVVSKDIKATVFAAGVVGSMNDIMYNWPHSPVLHDQPSSLVQSVRQGLLAKYGTPEANPDFWNGASAINYVSSITGAVQINQSVGDNMVPKLFADHLNQALTTAGKTPEYYIYPGNDHQFSYNRTLFLQRVIAFYKAHL